MTDALTAAAGFELESGDAKSVNRWTKKGDRLYVNDLDGNWEAGYVDLQTGEVEDTGENVTGEITVDGDTLTIEYVAKEYGISYTDTHEYTVVVEIDWGATQIDDDDDDTETDDVETTPAVDPETHEVEDGVEAGAEVIHDGERKTIKSVGRRNIRFEDGTRGAHEDCDLIVADTDEPELIGDGGQPTADEAFDDGEIEEAIDANAADSTVDELRDVLQTLQRSVEEVWSTHMDNVEDNAMELVAMDGDILVFADHTGQFWNAEFDHGPLGERDLARNIQTATKSLHHDWARRHTDYDWGVDDPVVVRKPPEFDAGRELVEAVMLNLTSRGLSPRQAWSVWGVLAGNSRNNWADRMGYDSHSGVSNAVRAAKEKIPLPYL